MKKGGYTLALNGSTGAENNLYQRNREWSVIPQVGYLIADRWVVGFQLSFGKKFQRAKSDTQATSTIPDYDYYSALPEIYSRYYLLAYRLKPFVQISSGYNIQWGNNQTGAVKTSSDSRNFAVSGAFGLNFRITKGIGLEALYNARFDNNSRIEDANDSCKYRLGLSMFFK